MKNKTIKKAFVICLLLVLCMGGCGNASKTSSANISIYDMQKAMVSAGTGFPEMITVNSNDADAKKNFSYVSDFDYSKVSAYFLSYSADGLADEIVVICTNDVSDTKDALDSLKTHVENRVKLYDQYEPEQAKRAKDARVFSKDNYAVLIISEDYGKIQAAFEEMLK